MAVSPQTAARYGPALALLTTLFFMWLKHSAEHSHRRKGTPLQSAMGMLTFYFNRAGDNLSKGRRQTLEKARDELRALFGKE